MDPDDFMLDERQERFLVALLHHRGDVQKASRSASIPMSTCYRWMKDHRFLAAYRHARRRQVDRALVTLELDGVVAAEALKQEMGDGATGSHARVAAAKAFLAAMFKAREHATIEDELAEMRANFEALQAAVLGKDTPASGTGAKGEPMMPVTPILDDDQAEAVSLRSLWMNLVGHDQTDIAASVKFNRPQSVAEELYTLELVKKLQAAERSRAEGENA